MSLNSRQRNREHAAYMKEKNIKRTTGSCPLSCGAQIANGGPALLSHLNVCGRSKTN